MPAISTSSKILLTGGTGFLGAGILKELIQRGFNVRAAVRNERKADHIRKQFQTYGDKLEFVFVEDITSDRAFDEAVKGVDGIIHSAAPLPSPAASIDPNTFIHPSVNGTLSILKSALSSPSTKRVVLTSSLFATWEASPPPHVYTEEEWNDGTINAVKQLGNKASGVLGYAAAKTIAERSAWEWVEEANPQFDLVTVLPTFIWGEILSETTADIRGSNNMLLAPLKSTSLSNLTDEALLGEVQAVDLGDVSRLHVDSLLLPAAGGERFLGHVQTVTVQHILNVLNARPVEGIVVPRGKPELLDGWKAKSDFSSQKSKERLGMTYRPIEDTIRETIIDALKHGWHQ